MLTTFSISECMIKKNALVLFESLSEYYVDSPANIFELGWKRFKASQGKIKIFYYVLQKYICSEKYYKQGTRKFSNRLVISKISKFVFFFNFFNVENNFWYYYWYPWPH